MYIRKIAAAAGFACGAAMAFAPISAADTATAASSFWPGIDGILAGLPAADTPALNLAISFDGISLLSSGDATATTVSGQYGFALAYGDHASAYAAGGFGNSASAIGTYALADAGSKTEGATGFNFNSATDIGNNADPSTYTGAPDGAYAGGGSLIGNTDALTASSNNTAQFIGNGGTDTETLNGGNSGAFAGDSGLIGYNHVAGSGNTAYTSGDIKGFGDGSAAVGGTGNSAFTNGTETGTNEGAFSGFGNYNSATADTNYTLDNHGVSATFGNYNYASIYGPANSTGHAGGVAATATTVEHDGNGNIALVSDPFGSTADSATAGSTTGASGNSDLAEVLLTHGNASATGGNNLYDIISLFGNAHSASLPAADALSAAAAPAASDPFLSLVNTEIAGENSTFEFNALLSGVYQDLNIATTAGTFDTFKSADLLAKDAPLLTSEADASKVTPLEYLTYGVDPIKAGIATDGTGPFNVFNGAETKFDDAYNVFLYAAENKGDLIPVADVFGNHLEFVTGAGATAATAFSDFWNFGVGDLGGYLGANLSFLDISHAAAADLFSLFDPTALIQ